MNRQLQFFAANLILVTAALAVACTPGAGSSPAPGTPGPTTTATAATPQPDPTGPPATTPAGTNVTSAAQAAALVFASDPRWAQMVPLRADMIGQSSWYESFEDGDGFAVNITVGSGDCPAGCIDQHVWHYRVDREGKVELIGEDGEDVQIEPGTGGAGDVNVVMQLTAGPTCPVETIPADPNCAGRAVANAELKIFDAQGNEVGTTTSDAEGVAHFAVPAGAYFVVPAPAEGLMGTPDAQAFSALGGDQVGLLFGYDTGIR
jgi:hypothetical protein